MARSAAHLYTKKERLRSWDTTYYSYTVVDTGQGYRITRHVAGGAGHDSCNACYGATKAEIEQYFRRRGH